MAKAKSICSVSGCGRVSMARGWCQPHYNRWHYAGTIDGLTAASDAAGPCLRCGAPVARAGAYGPPPSYCSRSCRSAVNNERVKVMETKRRRTARLERECQWDGCATVLADGENARANKWCRVHLAEKRRLESRDNPGLECSEAECSRPTRAKGVCNMHYKAILRDEGRIKRAPWDDRRRANDQVRRARKKGARVESVSLEVVAARDGFRCGLCDGDVDMALVWPHPMSKSLDHVLPLSRGGDHSYDNTQLAHLRCNVSKGNRVEGRPVTSSAVA